jgi:hypothetical protein
LMGSASLALSTVRPGRHDGKEDRSAIDTAQRIAEGIAEFVEQHRLTDTTDVTVLESGGCTYSDQLACRQAVDSVTDEVARRAVAKHLSHRLRVLSVPSLAEGVKVAPNQPAGRSQRSRTVIFPSAWSRTDGNGVRVQLGQLRRSSRCTSCATVFSLDEFTFSRNNLAARPPVPTRRIMAREVPIDLDPKLIAKSQVGRGSQTIARFASRVR